MKYNDSLKRLKLAFYELADAKQDYNLLGGTINFSLTEDGLTMVTLESTQSFPFNIKKKDQEAFRKANPQHEYKD